MAVCAFLRMSCRVLMLPEYHDQAREASRRKPCNGNVDGVIRGDREASYTQLSSDDVVHEALMA